LADFHANHRPDLVDAMVSIASEREGQNLVIACIRGRWRGGGSSRKDPPCPP